MLLRRVPAGEPLRSPFRRKAARLTIVETQLEQLQSHLWDELPVESQLVKFLERVGEGELFCERFDGGMGVEGFKGILEGAKEVRERIQLPVGERGRRAEQS